MSGWADSNTEQHLTGTWYETAQQRNGWILGICIVGIFRLVWMKL